MMMLAGLLGLVPSAAEAQILGSATSFSAGSAPAAVAVGDLNSDAHLDVVVANTASNDVSVLLGDGTGNLGAAASFPAGSAPASVAVGDLNGDGHPDVVVADNASNAVSVLLGSPSGSLSAPVSFATCAHPASVALGELNGDGRLDVVVACNGTNLVSVLLGNGAGSLAGTSSATLSGAVTNQGPAPSALMLTDVNGDGRLDLAVAVSYGNLAIALGDGTGGFTSTGTWGPGGGDTTSVTAADVDGNGDVDFVTQTRTGSTYLYYNTRCSADPCSDPAAWGNGTPGAGRFQVQSFYFGGAGGYGFVAFANMNGTLGPDLLTNGYGFVSVRRDVGGAGPTDAFSVSQTPLTALAVGDLNGDGKPDVVASDGGSNQVAVLLNSSAPTVHLSATSLNFGDQEVGTAGATQTIVVQNWGDRDLNVSGVTVSGANASDFTVDASTCLAAPLPRVYFTTPSCQIDVGFTPQAAGARSATLAIASDAPSSPDLVPLTGNGLLLADLGVSVTGSTTVRTRSSLAYAVNVTNAGPTAAANVVMTNPTPYGTSFQSVQAPAGWSCTAPLPGKAGTVRCTTPSLAKNAAASTSVVVKVTARPDRGVVNNTATVTSDAPDPNTANNSASLTTSVTK